MCTLKIIDLEVATDRVAKTSIRSSGTCTSILDLQWQTNKTSTKTASCTESVKQSDVVIDLL